MNPVGSCDVFAASRGLALPEKLVARKLSREKKFTFCASVAVVMISVPVAGSRTANG